MSIVIGTADYARRRCQWCGKPAQIHDIDGSWCCPEHRTYDRQSETTWRRRWQS